MDIIVYRTKGGTLQIQELSQKTFEAIQDAVTVHSMKEDDENLNIKFHVVPMPEKSC